MFRLIYYATYDNEYQVEIKIALYCNHTIFIIVNPVIWNIRQHLKMIFIGTKMINVQNFRIIIIVIDIILTAVMHDVRLHLCRSAVRVDLITYCQSPPPSCTECHKYTKKWIPQTQTHHRCINTECAINTKNALRATNTKILSAKIQKSNNCYRCINSEWSHWHKTKKYRNPQVKPKILSWHLKENDQVSGLKATNRQRCRCQ